MLYDLYAFIIRMGSMRGGWWEAYIRDWDTGRWYRQEGHMYPATRDAHDAPREVVVDPAATNSARWHDGDSVGATPLGKGYVGAEMLLYRRRHSNTCTPRTVTADEMPSQLAELEELQHHKQTGHFKTEEPRVEVSWHRMNVRSSAVRLAWAKTMLHLSSRSRCQQILFVPYIWDRIVASLKRTLHATAVKRTMNPMC